MFEFYKNVTNLIWLKLGINPKIQYFPVEDQGYINSTGFGEGLVGDVLESRYETHSTGEYQRGFWKNELNLFVPARLCYLTKKERASIFKQLTKNIRISTGLMLLTLFAIVAVVFSYLMKINHTEVLLDILRTATGVAMIHQPVNRLSKCIFLSLILAFIIITSYLQSKLSVILTARSTRFIDVKNVTDLVSSRLRAHAEEYFLQIYYGTPLDGQITPVQDFPECLNLLKRDSNVVCIQDCDWLKYYAVENHEFHISQDNAFDRYCTILFRDDSPLLDRIRIIYYRLFEHGINSYLIDLEMLRSKKPEPASFNEISIYQQRYVFYIFTVLCAVGFFVFILEIIRGYGTRALQNIKTHFINMRVFIVNKNNR